MKKISTEEYKEILIDLLKYIDDICRENNIKYSLLGGSLIGAIREKGIIPWDDDIDIILIDDQYEKLIKILKNDNNKKYKLIDNDNNKSYFYPFPKLVNTKTMIKEKDVNEINNYGAYIDIFRYNYVPNNKILRRIHYSILNTSKTLLNLSSNTKHYKNIFKRLVSYISRKIGYRHLIKIYNKIFNLYSNKKNAKYIISNWTAYGYNKEIQKSSNFKEFIDCEFSGIKAMISKDYDEILTTTFGNYMKPVKPKNQETSHDIEAYWI